MTTRTYDDLTVTVHDDAQALGAAVAEAFAAEVRTRMAKRDVVGVVLATGNSQVPFTDALAAVDLDWSRIEVFHLDEYLGIDENHEAGFRRWMRERVVDPFEAGAFHGLEGQAEDPEAEARRYAALLADRNPDVAVIGIGENGHIAFNDPPAEFHTLDLVRVVELDQRSRQQQVGEGHFPSLEATPRFALSLTIPALLSRRRVLVGVPEVRKAEAVQATLEGPITRQVPASILRTCPRAGLHLDRAAASRLAWTG